MGELAIQVAGLGKTYRISHQTRRNYKTLQEEVTNLLRRPLRRGADSASPQREIFWALKDISFKVKQGEVLGIIGRNGAGKSTLLKILSRITRPTTGYADLYGRVGSLLEVGTGFHPELSGRENIYLNGAILGMRRREIQRQFAAIVDFAEVEQFIDTPVKRYSSGMYMRLAFAVAAHLEPEILIVDEVLAVGDTRFQEKSLGKMGEVAQGGRTVLFVSHNMAAVQHLCTRGLVMEQGAIVADAPIEEAVRTYMALGANMGGALDFSQRLDRKGEGHLRFTHMDMRDADDNPIQRIMSGQDVRLRFYYQAQRSYTNASLVVSFNIHTPLGLLLSNLNTRDVGKADLPISAGEGWFECLWERVNLRTGVYRCNLYCAINGQIQDWIIGAFDLHVEDGDYFGTGSLVGRQQGDVLMNYMWNSGTIEESDAPDSTVVTQGSDVR